MYHVFIVDDEAVISDGLRLLINWDQFECVVHTYTRASEALENYRSIQPDIVVADISMPGMSGLEMIEAMHSDGKYCRFIILSGYSEFRYAQKAMTFGVQSYLLKPVDENEFNSELIKALSFIKSAKEMERAKNKNSFSPTELVDIPKELLKKLEDSIENMNPAQAKKLTEDIFRLYSVRCLTDLEELRRRSFNILFCCVKNLSQFEIEMNAALGTNVLSLSDTKKLDTPDKIHYWMQNLIRMIIEIKKEREQDISSADLFPKILRYVDAGYTQSISLASVSQVFFLNPSYLSQLFRKKTGNTFLHYVTSKRIERARFLLTHSNYKISDICEKVGYEDIKYFSKLFHRHTGKTPGEFRKTSAGIPVTPHP